MHYVNLRQNTTPEIYIGYNTSRAPLGNPEGFKPDQTVSYSIPSTKNFKPGIVYLEGNWKNNPDNMKLQNDTGRILLTYHARSVNIIAGGKGGGVVFSDEGGGAAAGSTAKLPNKSLGADLSQDDSFRIDGQRLWLDRCARQREVVAHAVDVTADPAEIGLHVDRDHGRVVGPQRAVERPWIGFGFHEARGGRSRGRPGEG